ncbi:esterase/lipase [Gracilibacillus halotolerans]|uniref:Esterase/lipase n=1 Tax=Gracilibacillus halotolerans TaxID=74386 RepID=A0A841RR75_9BACI|nr:alpha/beta fold hydrolase [Gracilibacillus halotolerans]MBB6513108.1 esterase/lipase [Gracilibacillus halotolerans]
MTACLLIHGFTGGPYEVEPLDKYLREHTDWRIETVCLPGHGLGEEGKGLDLAGVSHKVWIKTAEEAFLHIREKEETIYLIGFSMGGMIASYLAAKYQVEKLVLLSASRKFFSIPRMSMDIANFAWKAVRRTLNTDPVFANYRRKFGLVPFSASVEFLKCMKFTKPYLKKIKTPVFIVQGIQDGMVPYKSVHYLDKEIPAKTEVVYFYNSKHLILLGEDKDLVIQAVFSFLTKKLNKKNTSVRALQ